jgi:hypothetical protein
MCIYIIDNMDIHLIQSNNSNYNFGNIFYNFTEFFFIYIKRLGIIL